MNKFYKKGLFLLLAVTNSYSASVLIRHVMFQDSTRHGSVESVKKYGLCSMMELFRLGLKKDRPPTESVMPGHFDCIYFAPVESGTLKDNPVQTVYKRVDPENVFVHNKELRVLSVGSKQPNKYIYGYSKITLAQYLERSNLAQKMRESCPAGKTVLRDQYTSEPFYADLQDPRYKQAHWFYPPEIIYEDRACIPASELLFWEDVNKPNEASQSN